MAQKRTPRPIMLCGLALCVLLPIVLLVVVIAVSKKIHTAESSRDFLQFLNAPDSASTPCTTLIAQLPNQLINYQKIRTPESSTITWKNSHTSDISMPIQLRCGITRPYNLKPESSLRIINSIHWLVEPVQERPTLANPNAEYGSIWIAVDRRPYVAVWFPRGAPVGVLQELSQFLSQKLPAQPLDFGRPSTNVSQFPESKP